jgi:quinol monooxygenase YgiN
VTNCKGVEREVEVVEQVVRLTVSVTINEGQTDAFKSIAEAMTECSKAEPGTLGYEWFAQGDGNRFTLLETYVDAAAVEAHFMGPAVQEWVPKLAAVCAVNGFEIYGDPGPKVAAMAAGFGAVILKYWMGIER